MDLQLEEDLDDSIWQAFNAMCSAALPTPAAAHSDAREPNQQLLTATASPCSTASASVPQLQGCTALQQQHKAPAHAEETWMLPGAHFGSSYGCSSISIPGSSCNSASEPAAFTQHSSWHHQEAAAAAAAVPHDPAVLWEQQQQPGCPTTARQNAGHEFAMNVAAAAAGGSSGMPALPHVWSHSNCAFTAALHTPMPLPAAAAAAASNAAFNTQSHFAAAQLTDTAAAAAAPGIDLACPLPSGTQSLSSAMSVQPPQADSPPYKPESLRQAASAPLRPPAAAGGKRAASAGQQQGSGCKRVRQQRISKMRHEEEVAQLKAQVSLLTAANAKLTAQVADLSASQLELLERMAGLTSKWRGSVADNAALQQQNIAAREQVAALQQQLAQAMQQGC
uniref:BZIP domain-containing protein n=1 Tax=Tetradesmus obliquus TaxID=3088 RepID=A0A383W6V7_TETOB|eukprot:jgi/Sobl393_1/12120/SZX72872.1